MKLQEKLDVSNPQTIENRAKPSVQRPIVVRSRQARSEEPLQFRISCTQCALNKNCLAKTVDKDQVVALEALINHPRPYHTLDHLYRQCDSFKHVYAVRSGAVKTYRVNEDGDEQITGFYLPGELFGFDGFIDEHHNNSAVALDTTTVCEMPFQQLEDLYLTVPSLQRRFIATLCHEIQAQQQLLMLLSQKNADERLATFLMSLSARFDQRKLSASNFSLPMSRKDIAAYLGLATETVSRLFTRFQDKNLLCVEGRSITIKNMEALQAMSI